MNATREEMRMRDIWLGIAEVLGDRPEDGDIDAAVDFIFWLEGESEMPGKDVLIRFEELLTAMDPEPASQIGVWLVAVRGAL